MLGLAAAPEIAAAVPSPIPPSAGYPYSEVDRQVSSARRGDGGASAAVRARPYAYPQYNGVKANDSPRRSSQARSPVFTKFTVALTMGNGPMYWPPLAGDRSACSLTSSRISKPVNRLAPGRRVRDAPR